MSRRNLQIPLLFGLFRVSAQVRKFIQSCRNELHDLVESDVKTETFIQHTDGKHTLKSWNYWPKLETHLFKIDGPQNPGDLWLLAPQKKTNLKRVTHIYDYLSQQFELPKQEAIQWLGKDSVIVEGLLFYPLDYEKGKKYPLAVLTHGGPRSSDKYSFGRCQRGATECPPCHL